MTAPKPKRKIPASVKKALAGECRDPQLAEVAANFVHIVGGPKKFAQLLYEEYKEAPKGSNVRSRTMEMILRAMKFANESQPDVGDLSLLTEDDLEREATALLERHPKEADDSGSPAA